jgi:hypothetical protein
VVPGFIPPWRDVQPVAIGDAIVDFGSTEGWMPSRDLSLFFFLFLLGPYKYMETKNLSLTERRLLNQKLLEYNETKEPLPVFLEIMKLDLTDRPQLKEDLYEVIEKIARLQPVEYV